MVVSNSTLEIFRRPMSLSYRERAVRAKLEVLLAKGSIVAIYVDPREHRFEILRADRESQIFQHGETVTIPDVLPGFSLPLVDLWP